MRVTDSFRTRSIIDNLNFSRERLTELQEQLASGKRVSRPSDDPLAVTRGIRLRTNLESNIQYGSNIDDSLSFLTTTETALNDAYQVMLDVRDLTLRGANDATSPREDIADQLELVLQNLLEISNTKFRGKFIFSGTETLALPFNLDENVFNGNTTGDIVNFRGNAKTYQRQLNENTIIDLNIPGNEVFDNTAKGGVSLFKIIWDLRADLKANDTEAIRANLDDVDLGMDQILKAQLSVGVRAQLAQFNEDRFTSQEILLKERLSQEEDTDFGSAFIQFKAEENALNSALSAGAKVISPSLLDYLR